MSTPSARVVRQERLQRRNHIEGTVTLSLLVGAAVALGPGAGEWKTGALSRPHSELLEATDMNS
jgi:hypothetical protein